MAAEVPVVTEGGALGKVEAAETVLPVAEPYDALVVRERREKEAFAQRTLECAAQTKSYERVTACVHV